MKWIRIHDAPYDVSDTGDVRNASGLTLKPQLKRGYLTVNLYRNGRMRTQTIHRLVAEAFIPNVENLPEVNHMDENRLNCSAGNLEWCTNSYNKQYSGKNKGKKVVCITTGQIFDSINDASRFYGIPTSNLSRVCNNERSTAGKMMWRFLKDGE